MDYKCRLSLLGISYSASVLWFFVALVIGLIRCQPFAHGLVMLPSLIIITICFKC